MPILKNFGRVTDVRCMAKGQKKMYYCSWFIKNFRKLYNNIGGWHESPTFSTGHGYQWNLNAYVAGYDETAVGYVGMEAFLKKQNVQHKPNITVELVISGEDCTRHRKPIVYSTHHDSRGEYAVTFKHFISKRDLSNKPEILTDGCLQICCVIVFEESSIDNEINPVHSDQKNQLKIFEKFFNNKKFSDFQLVVGSKQFHIHRLILAARSPVFEAMFDSKMRESTEGQVHIDDIEPNVMEKLLRFTYAGEVDVKYVADKVLVAAEKYQLDELKRLCEDSLGKNLNVANVYETLQLADKYNADELKKKTIEFFNKNMKELSVMKNFEASVSSLAAALQTQIICTFAKKL